MHGLIGQMRAVDQKRRSASGAGGVGRKRVGISRRKQSWQPPTSEKAIVPSTTSGDTVTVARRAVDAVKEAVGDEFVVAKEVTSETSVATPFQVPKPGEFDTAEEFVGALRRDIEGLSHSSAVRREEALERIGAACFGREFGTGMMERREKRRIREGELKEEGDGDSDDEEIGEGGGVDESEAWVVAAREREMVEEAFLGAMLRPVLRRVEDEAARVRERALEVIRLYLGRACSDLAGSLPFLAPALLRRSAASWSYDLEEHVLVHDLGAQDAHRRGRIVDDEERLLAVALADSDEHVRLALVGALETLWSCAVRLGGTALLRAHVHAMTMAAQALGRDPSPEVRVAGLGLVRTLVQGNADALTPLCPGLVKALAPGLRHRRASVREAAIAAIEALVLCPDRMRRKGAGTDALPYLVAHRDDNVIPVRAFYGQDVSVNYFAGVALDPTRRVRKRFLEAILAWLTHLPDRFDHEGRLLPYLLSALADDDAGLRKIARDGLDSLGRRLEEEKQDELLDRVQHGVLGDERVDYDRPYPFPVGEVPTRPRLGARLLIRQHSRRFLRPILDELVAWKGDARPRAARLLVTVLSFLEENCTEEAPRLVRVVLKLVDDPEMKHVLPDLAHCTGRFVDPSTTVPLLLPYLQGDIRAPAAAAAGADASGDVSSRARIARGLALILAHSRKDRLISQWSNLARALVHLGPDLLRPVSDPQLFVLPEPFPVDSSPSTSVDSSILWDYLAPSALQNDRSVGFARSRYVQLAAVLTEATLGSGVSGVVEVVFGASGRLRECLGTAKNLFSLLLALEAQAALEPTDLEIGQEPSTRPSLTDTVRTVMEWLARASGYASPALWIAETKREHIISAIESWKFSPRFAFSDPSHATLISVLTHLPPDSIDDSIRPILEDLIVNIVTNSSDNVFGSPDRTSQALLAAVHLVLAARDDPFTATSTSVLFDSTSPTSSFSLWTSSPPQAISAVRSLSALYHLSKVTHPILSTWLTHHLDSLLTHLSEDHATRSILAPIASALLEPDSLATWKSNERNASIQSELK